MGECARNEQQQPADRITELPKEIRAYILSLLTLKDAARTSVLSRHWIDVWMYVTVLQFDTAKESEVMYELSDSGLPDCRRAGESSRQKFVEWVNKVLVSHKAIDLDAFRICFDLDNSSTNDIDKWLQNALTRRVDRLDLNFLPYAPLMISARTRRAYAFRPDLLGSSCGSGFKSLRASTFNKVNVSGPALEFLLRNCPSLEHVVVVKSDSLEELVVCGPSLALKYLEIDYCYKLHSLSICDTNIVSLKVPRGDSLVVKNAPKLVDVSIGISQYVGNLVDCAVMSKLSCCLSKLEGLTLHITNLQADMAREEAAVPELLPKLKQLTFVMYGNIDVSLIAVFASLIRLSPNLEKFVLKTDRMRYFEVLLRGCNPYSRMIVPVAIPLQHLKVVEIRGYCGLKTKEVGLVKYLVENAVALERIIIDPRDQSAGPCLPAGGPLLENPEEEAFFRNLAKEQLEPLVLPSHVELVFL